MLVLTIRTDNPEAEIGLFNNDDKLAYITWEGHRELSSTIHLKIKDLLNSQAKNLKDLEGLVIYKGPGSFTGLRIGFSVANALSYSLNIPIVAEMSESWVETGVKRLANGANEKVALPEYGRDPHITKQTH